MTPQRPASVTVIAILQLVFGSLNLLCGLAGLATQGGRFNPAGGAGKEQEAFQKELEDAMAREMPNQKPVQVAETASSLVLSVLMLASGIGMLNLRPWGRLLGLVYAVLGMASTLAGLAYAVGVVMPALDRAAASVKVPKEQEQVFSLVMKVTPLLMIGLSVLALVYQVIVLVVLTRPSVKRAFAGLPPVEGPEDYHDRAPPQQYDEPAEPGPPDDRYR